MAAVTREQLIDLYGEHGECPDYTHELWKLEVENDETLQGYWDWVVGWYEFDALWEDDGETHADREDLDGDISKDDL
jgi:hypothetical protein